MKTQPQRLAEKMTDTYYSHMDPRASGIKPKVADLWVESISDTDKVWWRWTGKHWKHEGDNLASHQDNQGNA